MDAVAPSKEHRAPRAGAKAKKKKANEKKKKGDAVSKGNNPKAFIFKSSSKARKARTIAAEKQQASFGCLFWTSNRTSRLLLWCWCKGLLG